MTRPASRGTIAERRHAEIVEQLRRINTGVEALHQVAERETRLLAEISARVDAALKYFVSAWQAVRGQEERRP